MRAMRRVRRSGEGASSECRRFAAYPEIVVDRRETSSTAEPNQASGSLDRPARHVAPAGEQAGDRDILVELFPMETEAVQLEFSALRRRGAKQAGKPRQRHADGAAVAQVDPHRMFVKADCGRRNSHAKGSRGRLSLEKKK